MGDRLKLDELLILRRPANRKVRPRLVMVKSLSIRGVLVKQKLQKGKAFFIMEEKCTAQLYWSS